jgi:hypothetical protein
VHERRNAKRFTAPHIRSTIRRGVIANRQKASVARELLDDLSKDVIRNDRNLQLWLANAAANNLRAKLANEATPTPVYTFTPPTPSTDLSNAIRELTALVFAISNDTTVDLPPPSANATEYANQRDHGKRRERRSARSPMPEREGRLRHHLERHRRRRHRRRVPAANDDSRAPCAVEAYRYRFETSRRVGIAFN